MRTLFILRGLPGCGKSTFAAELIRKEPDRFVRINNDDLRCMIVGPGNDPHAHHPLHHLSGREHGENERIHKLDREELIHRFRADMIRTVMREGFDVIVDNTHLVAMTVKKLHQLAETIGDVKVIEKCFNVSVDDCIARDAKRIGFAHVGEKVIRDMARGAGLDKKRTLTDKETYYPPRWSPGGPGADPYKVQQDTSLPKAIICDLDGTLSLLNGRNPYDASECDKDLPNVPVIECVKAMHERSCKVLFTSGREEQYREQTERFIAQHLPAYTTPHGQKAWYQLFMRSTGDQRKDSIVKRELFEANIAGKYYVVFCLDDRNQVVNFWREIGLTCFQCAPGNF